MPDPVDTARDLDTILDRRYWLTPKGWAATQPPVPDPPEDCPACNGTGTTPTSRAGEYDGCTVCNGTGTR